MLQNLWLKLDQDAPRCGMTGTDFLMEGESPYFFTISSTDVSSIPWLGSLAERVVANLQFSISKKQSKTRAANFRLDLGFCVFVLVSCLCCRSFPLQREVLWELAVTSMPGSKSCCSGTLERSSDNGYLRKQVWFPARHGSKLGLHETTVKISSALAFFFFQNVEEHWFPQSISK